MAKPDLVAGVLLAYLVVLAVGVPVMHDVLDILEISLLVPGFGPHHRSRRTCTLALPLSLVILGFLFNVLCLDYAPETDRERIPP